jgi:hypothetical protein
VYVESRPYYDRGHYYEHRGYDRGHDRYDGDRGHDRGGWDHHR